MNFVKIAWGAVSALLAVGLNVGLKPKFERTYDGAEYAQATGQLSLQGESGELPMMTLHVVTANVEHLGRVFKVRELVIRGASPAAQAPRFELFVTLPEANGDDLVSGPHNPQTLRGVDLTVAAKGSLGTRSSYVVLGGEKHRAVVLGTLRLSDLELSDDGSKPPTFSTSGRLDLQIETDHGVDLLNGKLSGHLVWDPSAT